MGMSSVVYGTVDVAAQPAWVYDGYVIKLLDQTNRDVKGIDLDI